MIIVVIANDNGGGDSSDGGVTDNCTCGFPSPSLW